MLSEQQALEETRDMWNKMGESAEKGFVIKKSDATDKKYISNCPCCEYAAQFVVDAPICGYCPITWPSRHCMNQGSYFRKWTKLMEDRSSGRYVSFMDMSFFCFLIADLASESLKELLC